jgi:hypothetical protein
MGSKSEKQVFLLGEIFKSMFEIDLVSLVLVRAGCLLCADINCG